MPNPIFYAENVMAGADFALTPDGAESGFGVERLADWDIGLECRDSGTTGTRTWTADRGLDASTPMVDTWVLIGRSYTGETLTLDTSSNGLTWTTRGTVTPADDVAQVVSLTPFACPRYVRMQVTDPAQPVILMEWVLAPAVTLTVAPVARATREPLVLNVALVSSLSGRGWGIQRGARRWAAEYLIAFGTEADRLAYLGLADTLLDGVRPCWAVSVKSELRWVRVTFDVTLEAAEGLPIANWAIPLHLVEELP